MPARGDCIRRAGLSSNKRRTDARPADDAGDGQDAQGSEGRRAGGHRLRLLHGRQSRAPIGDTVPSELPRKLSMTLRHPIGIVGLITPWNFPSPSPPGSCGPRSSPATASCSSRPRTRRSAPGRWSRSWPRPACPGRGQRGQRPRRRGGPGARRASRVRAISFTGSFAKGQLIATECGRQMKRYSMELGSKNVSIVMPDADLDLAVEGIAWGAFATSGQRCTATSRVVSLHPELADALVEKVRSYKLGPGDDESVDLAPLINRDPTRPRARVRPRGRRGRQGPPAHRRPGRRRRRVGQGQLRRADGVHRCHARTCASPRRRSSAR